MREPISSKMQTFWAVLYSIESFLIISGNLMAIRIFLHKKFTVAKSSYMLVNLTVADILVGVSAFLTLLEVVYSSEFMFIACKGTPINRIAQSCSLFALFASLISLALMALERALAVVIPFRFRRVTSTHYAVAILMSWCIAIPLVFLRLINTCSDMKARIITNNFVISIMAIDVIVIVVSYAAIFIKKWFFPDVQPTVTSQKNMKLTKTLMITTGIALLTWMPRFAGIIFKPVMKGYRASGLNVPIALLYIINSNSFANLLVYTFRMTFFREEVKKMLMCRYTVNQVGPAPLGPVPGSQSSSRTNPTSSSRVQTLKA